MIPTPRVLLAVLALAPASVARAADFTFLVPVTVQNVPADSFIRVTCTVSRNPVDAPTMSAMGTATVERAVPGSLTETISVAVNATPAGTAGAAHSYYCGASLGGGRPASGVGGWSVGPDSVTPDLFARVTGRTLREWRARVQGPIR